MRILIIEDEERLSDAVARGLKTAGFAVDVAADGERGLEMTKEFHYAAIILDIMLPKISGSEVLSRIRQVNRQVPILMLTARVSVDDKVAYIEAGADDYLTKPFSFAELLVRIRALLRRAPLQQNNILRLADMEIDRPAHTVKRSGVSIELSAKEYMLLEYLALNAGRVLSRNMIVEQVWDRNFEGLTNIVDVYVRQLRAKIDDGFEYKLIKTVRGVGYKMEEAV